MQPAVKTILERLVNGCVKELRARQPVVILMSRKCSSAARNPDEKLHTNKMDDKTLEELAVQELLSDAKRGKERYKTMGPSGWQKNLIPRANKEFLQRTLASSLHTSSRQKTPQKRKPEPNLANKWKTTKRSAVTSNDCGKQEIRKSKTQPETSSSKRKMSPSSEDVRRKNSVTTLK